MKNDICFHCGASIGLHHYGTRQCPKGGREARVGEKQLWSDTMFEDSGLLKLHRGSAALLVAAKKIQVWIHSLPEEEQPVVSVLKEFDSAIDKCH